MLNHPMSVGEPRSTFESLFWGPLLPTDTALQDLTTLRRLTDDGDVVPLTWLEPLEGGHLSRDYPTATNRPLREEER